MFSNSYTVNKPKNYTYLSKINYNTDHKCYYNNKNYEYIDEQINQFNIQQDKLKKKISKQKN